MHCTPDIQAIATTELHSHLEQQASVVAPEFNPPTDKIAATIRLIKLGKVREALVEGKYYWDKRQNFKKLKDFKAWLEQQGFTWKDACKHIKLYETFAKFSLEQIGWLSLDTLFALCQPKYLRLVEQLHCGTRWIDTKIQELMKVCRQQQKKLEKPKRERTGLVNLACGGRAFQFPLLHDDKAIAQILRIQEYRQDATLTQLAAEAIALLFEQEDRLHRQGRCVEVPSTPCRPRSLHLNGYGSGVRSVKDWHHNAKVLQRATEEEVAT